MITAEQIIESDLQIHRILDLDVMLTGDPIPSDLVEWIEDHELEPLIFEAIGVPPEVIAEMTEDGLKLREMIEESSHYRGRRGWLIECSNPKYTPYGDGKGAEVNQGWRRHHFVRGVTYEEALDAALKAVNDDRAKQWPGH